MVRRWRQISKVRIVTHEERRTSCKPSAGSELRLVRATAIPSRRPQPSSPAVVPSCRPQPSSPADVSSAAPSFFCRDDNLKHPSVSSRLLFPRNRSFSFRDDNVAPFTTSSRQN